MKENNPEKDALPKHLKHVDRYADETKSLVARLENKTEKQDKYSGVIIKKKLEEAKTDDPLKKELDNFYIRLNMNYCTLREENKKNLKITLSSLRKKNSQDLIKRIKEENLKLDSMERAYKLKIEVKRKEMSMRSIGFLEKIKFWLHQRRSKNFSGGKPSISVFEYFDFQVKPKYEKISALLNHVLDFYYNNDFFSEPPGNPLDGECYNLLSIFSKDKMGRALAMVAPADMSADLRSKIKDLDEFSKLYIYLNDNPKRKTKVIGSLNALSIKLNNLSSLSEGSRKLVKYSSTAIESIIPEVAKKYPHFKTA